LKGDHKTKNCNYPLSSNKTLEELKDNPTNVSDLPLPSSNKTLEELKGSYEKHHKNILLVFQ